MRRLPALVLGLALLGTACAGGATTDPDVGQAQQDAGTGEAAAAGADEAADGAADEAAPSTGGAQDATDGEPTTVEALWWDAPSLADGTQLSAPEELAGEKVVLWMWAPWCGVCNREAPEVAEALAELPDDVRVVGVAGRDDVGPMEEFVARHGLEDITHVVDADGSIWGSYGISYQPAWVFVEPDGNATVAPGALGRDGLLRAVDEVFGA